MESIFKKYITTGVINCYLKSLLLTRLTRLFYQNTTETISDTDCHAKLS